MLFSGILEPFDSSGLWGLRPASSACLAELVSGVRKGRVPNVKTTLIGLCS